MPTQSSYQHLESRCHSLIAKYIQPIIDAEDAALTAGNPIPAPDYDNLSSFRLLAHAELEGYFEDKAKAELDKLDNDFKSDIYLTQKLSSLMMLFIWSTQLSTTWTGEKQAASDFKQLAQQAIGFGRAFIKENNGIKEKSINTLSAIMGLYPHEVDEVLINELNEFGKKRGAVAHKSWMHNTRTFDSADIEKNNVLKILNLIKVNYETTTTAPLAASLAAVAPASSAAVAPTATA